MICFSFFLPAKLCFSLHDFCFRCTSSLTLYHRLKNDVTNEMRDLGVVVCDGMPAVDPRLHDVIAASPPAHLALQNVTLAPSPMNHERSRLPGKVGKAIDMSP